jgi:hypothetical protein
MAFNVGTGSERQSAMQRTSRRRIVGGIAAAFAKIDWMPCRGLVSECGVTERSPLEAPLCTEKSEAPQLCLVARHRKLVRKVRHAPRFSPVSKPASASWAWIHLA